MIGFRRLRQLRLPSSPAGRAGSAMMSMVVLATVLTVGAGVGYSVARPLLGDGSAYLSWGHTVVRANGESGQADARSGPVAGGTEPTQTVRLPDGRVVSVNKQTGAITLIDAATMASSSPLRGKPGTATGLEAIATDSGGYLVNTRTGTVQQLPPPGTRTAPAAVPVQGGIRMAVPSGNSVLVLTEGGGIVEVNGTRARPIPVGERLSGITVADGHPVVVTARGKAYTLDSDRLHPIGDVGLTGPNVALGSWRGSGQYVLAVDTKTGHVAILDPRGGGGRPAKAKLPVPYDTKLGAPVVLDKDVYVPDFTGSRLWRVNAVTGAVRPKPLSVPRQDHRDFDLQVSGGHVWANNQYDPTALIVDRDGRDHHADKSAGTNERGRGVPEPRPDQRHSPGGNPALGRPEDPSKRDPVAPGRAPSTIGQPHREACRLIVRAGLRCRQQTDPTGAVDPDQVGVVISQNPQPGTTPPDKEVTITYPDRFTMPSVIGQTQGEACTQLRKYTLNCRAVSGAAAAGGHRPGEVYEQNPAEETIAREGDTAQLRYYGGSGPVGRYVGRNVDEACAQVEADGFQCVPQKGQTAAGTGQQPRTVYQQNPAPAARQDINRPVTLTFYSDTNIVPDVRNRGRDEACDLLRQAGFICTDQSELARNFRIVNRQDGAGTEQPIGTPVNIYWSPWQPVTYVIYRHNSLNVWALAPDGAPPAGYGEPKYVVGTAYGPDAQLPGHAMPVNLYECTVGNRKCRGLDVNRLYSHGIPQLGIEQPRWQGPTRVATFMDCNFAAGAKRIYRVWKDHDGWPNSGRGYREEGITDSPNVDGWEDNEDLGCVW